jgi:purine-binding chemotaxis protein CheW
VAKAQAIPAARSGSYCTFRLAGRLFGFNILSVKEVNTHTTFTPVPQAPPAVCGYVNLRGDIALALDLRRLLGLEPARVTADARLLIFKASVGDLFGVLVDQIGDIVLLSEEAIEDWRPDGQAGAVELSEAWRAGELVEGIGKLDRELLIILNAHKLLRLVAESMQTGEDHRAQS